MSWAIHLSSRLPSTSWIATVVTAPRTLQPFTIIIHTTSERYVPTIHCNIHLTRSVRFGSLFVHITFFHLLAHTCGFFSSITALLVFAHSDSFFSPSSLPIIFCYCCFRLFFRIATFLMWWFLFFSSLSLFKFHWSFSNSFFGPYLWVLSSWVATTTFSIGNTENPYTNVLALFFSSLSARFIHLSVHVKCVRRFRVRECGECAWAIVSELSCWFSLSLVLTLAHRVSVRVHQSFRAYCNYMSLFFAFNFSLLQLDLPCIICPCTQFFNIYIDMMCVCSFFLLTLFLLFSLLLPFFIWKQFCFHSFFHIFLLLRANRMEEAAFRKEKERLVRSIAVIIFAHT